MTVDKLWRKESHWDRLGSSSCWFDTAIDERESALDAFTLPTSSLDGAMASQHRRRKDCGWDCLCPHQLHRRFITDDVGNGLVIKAVRELWHVPFCCLKTRAYSFCSKDNMNVALSSLRRRSVVVRPNIVGHQTKQHFLNKVRASQTSITLNWSILCFVCFRSLKTLRILYVQIFYHLELYTNYYIVFGTRPDWCQHHPQTTQQTIFVVRTSHDFQEKLRCDFPRSNFVFVHSISRFLLC